MDGVLGEILVARQPIVDGNLEVVGYELLYRDVDGRAPATQVAGLRATASVLADGLLALGRSVVTDGEDAYLNVPVPLLLDGTLLDVPPDGLVLELLEDAAPSDQLAAVLRSHRDAGFRLALDDVVPHDTRLALVDLVDVVKVDVEAAGLQAALSFIRDLVARGHTVLAEKVEEPEHFDRVIGAGASMVQGFFFTRPRAVRAIRPTGFVPTHLKLLQALAEDEVDLETVERLIRTDLTLTDRFLRLVAVSAGWRGVDSVHHGLVMLGERAVHRWVTLLVLSAIAGHAPKELVTVASVRARFCEEIELRRGSGQRLEAFSLGMFSVLGPDGVVAENVLAELPLSDEVRAALRGQPGPFRDLILVQLAAEAADWDRLVAAARRLGIDPRGLAEAHMAALRWATEVKAAV